MSADPNETARRREFGAFLRSRRERLVPRQAGLPQGFRRRTPGLRREEVALLAGVGTTWYTWLEQGREVRASVAVLSALAEALQLSDAEAQYLFALSGQSGAVPSPHPLAAAQDSLLRLVGALGQPAQLVDQRWDILAWNHAAAAVFGDYAHMAPSERNLLYQLFANAGQRTLLIEWEAIARSALALFRSATATCAGDARLQQLVSELERLSPEFRAWWSQRDVAQAMADAKLLMHPEVGHLAFEHLSLSINACRELRLMVYMPLPEHDTAAKLGRLIARAKSTEPVCVDSFCFT